MAVYTINLLEKKEVAADTMAFRFTKPDGFMFRAGQYGDFTLIDPTETDGEGNVRSFSLASAPYEQDIVIATRMRDTAFKRVLRGMSVGSAVTMDAPHGNFTLHKAVSTAAVFLTGGIGITPVRSIIAQSSHDGALQDSILFYSNKTPGDAAFLRDLESYAKENPRFIFVPVMTRAAPDEWPGERGHITSPMLATYIKDFSRPVYYLSGPAGMVASMRRILAEAGADEDNMRTEEFTGY